MFGATPYLVEEFSIEKAEARKILKKWMNTFDERNLVDKE